jgi:hypothetical protein
LRFEGGVALLLSPLYCFWPMCVADDGVAFVFVFVFNTVTGTARTLRR